MSDKIKRAARERMAETGEPYAEARRQVIIGPCGATDGAGLVGDGPDDLTEPYGRCTLVAGHDSDWHQEWRDGHLWAEWRGPHPGQRCGICHRDGCEH